MGSSLSNSTKENPSHIDYCATPRCFNPPTPQGEQSVEKYEGLAKPGFWWLAPPVDWCRDQNQNKDHWNWGFLPWAFYTKHASIHMPSHLSRFTVEVTNSRAKQVYEISFEESRAAGFETGEFLEYDEWQRSVSSGCGACSYRTLLSDMEKWWNKKYAKQDYAWRKNPWAFGIDLRQIQEEKQ